MGLALAPATRCHDSASTSGWSPRPTTTAWCPSRRARVSPARSDVAMPSCQRSLATNRTASAASGGTGRSVAPRTTYSASRPAAAALSMAHSTTVRPWKGASSLWTSPPDAVNRDPPPAASTIAATVTASAAAGRPGVTAVDRALRVAQRSGVVATGALGDDLGTDRHRRLFRRAGTDVEADRCPDPKEGLAVDTRLLQPGDPLGGGPPAAHGPRVAHVGAPRRHQGGDVELGVVRQHTHSVARGEPGSDAPQQPVGPVDHHLVGLREPRPRREHLP